MTELKNTNKMDHDVARLLRLMYAGDQILQTAEMSMKPEIAQIKAKDPDFPADEYTERILQRVDVDNMLYQMVPIYSRYYTNEEITDLIAFEKTPLGQKQQKLRPLLVQESIVTFQTWAQVLMEKSGKEMDALSSNGGDYDISKHQKIEFLGDQNETTKLLNLKGVDFYVMVSNWLEETFKTIQEQHPDVSTSDMTRFRGVVRKNIDVENLRDHYVALYNRHYSQEEIAELIAFYESPVGRKQSQVNQQIAQEIRDMEQAYFLPIIKEVLEEMAAEGLI